MPFSHHAVSLPRDLIVTDPINGGSLDRERAKEAIEEGSLDRRTITPVAPVTVTKVKIIRFEGDASEKGVLEIKTNSQTRAMKEAMEARD
jgi:hypothetical protein